MRVTVIYGTDNGSTRYAASEIASRLSGKAVDIAAATAEDFKDCDLLVLGTPTYGIGELQADWDIHLNLLKEVDLSGKKVALFGLGDQITYSDTFVDAVGLLYDIVIEKGASVIGLIPTEGYDFVGSLAARDGKFVGLVLDEDNQQSETGQRITSWVAQLA